MCVKEEGSWSAVSSIRNRTYSVDCNSVVWYARNAVALICIIIYVETSVSCLRTNERNTEKKSPGF